MYRQEMSSERVRRLFPCSVALDMHSERKTLLQEGRESKIIVSARVGLLRIVS